MLAKILTKTGYIFGKIVNKGNVDYFVTPSGKMYLIDMDGNVNYNGEICKVLIAIS